MMFNKRHFIELFKDAIFLISRATGILAGLQMDLHVLETQVWEWVDMWWSTDIISSSHLSGLDTFTTLCETFLKSV
jgi:hypothetical protein